MNEDWGIWWGVGLTVAGTVAGIVALVFLAAHCSAEWEKECAARGGHTKHLYKHTLCLSHDGRIIEL